MSPSDNLKMAQAKMQEYQDNGARLGWLINRKDREVEVYRIGQSKEVLQNPISLSIVFFFPLEKGGLRGIFSY